MKFARIVFSIAGIYGLVVLLPQYFLEEKNGRDFPPPITHPEYYYGFIGVALAWQVLFLVLARDPARYRAMMIPAVLEKAAFGVAVPVLFLLNRAPALMLAPAMIDLILGLLFVVAYLKTASDQTSRAA
ncbi:MAG TPA: hypothetical protein VGX92_03920 [Pyrinomonadaceae bacterium]|jgi:hypothetical protein|nr:hypothetical protein [Pyrinomonadaceae bacterium]